MEDLSTEVWTLKGATGSDPGLMSFADGQVQLQVYDDDDTLRQAFHVPLSDITDVKFPKLQMSGGCSLSVNGQKFRLSFLKPQNTRTPLASGAVAGVASISGGRKAGKAWKEILLT